MPRSDGIWRDIDEKSRGLQAQRERGHQTLSTGDIARLAAGVGEHRKRLLDARGAHVAERSRFQGSISRIVPPTPDL